VELGGDIAALYVTLDEGIEDIVREAREAVAEWRWARPHPLPHRLEPLLHERLWLPSGELLDTPPDNADGHERYGWGAAGDIVLYLTGESTLPDGVPPGHSLAQSWWQAWYGGGEVVLAQGGIVVCAAFVELRSDDQWRFRFDGLVRYGFADGRVVGSEYLGWGGKHPESGSERYVYDATGRLIAIDEYDSLSETTPWFGTRDDVIPGGGMLEVRDADDPKRLTILSGQEIVWRPAPVPWPRLFEQRAEQAARECRAAIAAWSASSPDRSTRPVLAIHLDDYTQATPHAILSIAFERPHRTGHASYWKDVEIVDGIEFDDDEGTLLRVGAVEGADVQTAMSEAVAHRLRAFDWQGVLTLSDDFLVYVDRSENMPGECVASARRVNPPDVVDRWVSRGWLSTD
jgi:YD repeat-containing protein